MNIIYYKSIVVWRGIKEGKGGVLWGVVEEGNGDQGPILCKFQNIECPVISERFLSGCFKSCRMFLTALL